MDEKKRLVKNTLLIAIGNFGTKLISFLLLPLYTSILSTSEYGIYDYVVAIGAFLLPVVTFSMHEAMFRFIIDAKKDDSEFKKIVSNAFVSVIIGITILCLVLGVLQIFMGKNNDYLFLYVLVYLISSSLYVFANNLLRGLGRIKEYAIISSFKNTLQLILNVISIAVLRLGMHGLLLSICLSEIIGFLVVAIRSRLWSHINIKNVNTRTLKPMLKYAFPLIPNSIGTQIINISDRLVISWMMGSSANGIYSVSYKFPNIVDTSYHFFYLAWSESASVIFAKGIEKAKEYYEKLYYILDNFVFSFILMTISYMPILYRILIKGKYGSGFDYIAILMLSMYFNCIAKFYSGIYTAIKKTKIMAISTIIAAIINLGINILLINRFGLYAAAASTLIAEFILLIIRKKGVRDFIVIKERKTRLILKILLMTIVIALYDYNNFVKILISMILSTIAFIIYNRQTIMGMSNKVFKRRKKE